MKAIRSHVVFFGLALTGILVLGIFTWLAKRQLETGGIPQDQVLEFYTYNRSLSYGTIILFIVLLFTANIMYIKERYWDTFIWAGLLFATFTLIDWWWLSEMVFRYKKSNTLWMGESNLGPFVGVILAFFGLTMAIGNYFLLKLFIKDKQREEKGNKVNKETNQITTKK